MFGRLFGTNSKSKNANHPPIDLNSSIQKLRQAIVTLEKREQHLGKKIDDCVKNAKQKSKNKDKKGALFELKKKKHLEGQLQSIQGKKLNLETQIMTLEDAFLNKETLNVKYSKKCCFFFFLCYSPLFGCPFFSFNEKKKSENYKFRKFIHFGWMHTKHLKQAMQTTAQTMRAVMTENDADKADELIEDINEAMDQVQEMNEAMSQPLGPQMDEVNNYTVLYTYVYFISTLLQVCA
ncbi:hypothetical protein RFI_07949 [Reticulomyxa filosa]|uniref:SNF7 family protein n=1 Tax=Reticulomyxa filosa TaxID=46433 RepID=X6NT34_RETFI|nr:hypothetical protein RFI_07949 [Reticulomyxa filosa]|eukprot:ETO29176.1 hypothetical protein RFI_07949 [Reticulomyxa filosa]